MKKLKTISISLAFAAVILFGSLLINSCTKTPVSPIEPVDYVQPIDDPQFTGKVTKASDGTAIAGATVTVNGSAQTTDAAGLFSFEEPLSAGTANVTVSASGFVSVSRTPNIPAQGGSLFKEYSLTVTAPAVVVTAATGGDVTTTTEDGTTDATIPPGAVATDTPVSVTPTLGLTSPVDVNTITAVDEAPAQNVILSPVDVQFTQPVQMSAPQSFPAEYVTGAVNVIRINPTTGAQEVAGTAVMEGGKFKYNVTQGGQYILKAKTNLRHNVQTVTESVLIGEIGANEVPGTVKTFTYTEQTTVVLADGFSRNFVEGVFGFANSSRQVQYTVSKPTGANTIVKFYVNVKKTIHTYTNASGEVLAKVTADNGGTENETSGTTKQTTNVGGTHNTGN